MRELKIIIATDSNFNDYALLSEKCDDQFTETRENILLYRRTFTIEVVLGVTQGNSGLVQQYAKDRGYRTKDFQSELKDDSTVLDDQIKYAEGLVAFWDGKNPDIKKVINIAKQSRLYVQVIRYKRTVGKRKAKRVGNYRTKTFKDLYFMSYPDPADIRRYARLNFENEYGVSVSKEYRGDLWQVGILYKGELTDHSLITDQDSDVVYGLTEDGVTEVMKKVQAL